MLSTFTHRYTRVPHVHRISVRCQYKNHFPAGIRWFVRGSQLCPFPPVSSAGRPPPPSTQLPQQQQSNALKSLTQRFKKRISLANPQNQRLPGVPNSRVHTFWLAGVAGRRRFARHQRNAPGEFPHRIPQTINYYMMTSS